MFFVAWVPKAHSLKWIRCWGPKCPHTLSSNCIFPLPEYNRGSSYLLWWRTNPHQKIKNGCFIAVTFEWYLQAPDDQGLICMQITFKWFLSQTVCPDSFYINYWYAWKLLMPLLPRVLEEITNLSRNIYAQDHIVPDSGSFVITLEI